MRMRWGEKEEEVKKDEAHEEAAAAEAKAAEAVAEKENLPICPDQSLHFLFMDLLMVDRMPRRSSENFSGKFIKISLPKKMPRPPHRRLLPRQRQMSQCPHQ